MAVKDPLQGGDGDNEWRELDPLLAAGWGHSEPSGQKDLIATYHPSREGRQDEGAGARISLCWESSGCSACLNMDLGTSTFRARWRMESRSCRSGSKLRGERAEIMAYSDSEEH